MRYIVCLLINVIIAVAFDWPEAIVGIFFALMAEGAVLSEMKVRDNMNFWKDHPNI